MGARHQSRTGQHPTRENLQQIYATIINAPTPPDYRHVASMTVSLSGQVLFSVEGAHLLVASGMMPVMKEDVSPSQPLPML
ncbi:hypothetical protein BGX28_005938 [Mortierella sp. GBA30]|nr:hypothetical protein BGX28_005938 [Mortierella sp. GBA30]